MSRPFPAPPESPLKSPLFQGLALQGLALQRLALQRLALQGLALALTALAVPFAAQAQQPLEEFLAAAAQHEPNLLAARAEAGVVAARVDLARASLLPSLSVAAGYQRNSDEVKVQRPDADGVLQTSSVLPYNQFDASVLLDVPLVNALAWTEVDAVSADVEGAAARARAVQMQVRVQVIQAWHRLVGAREVVAAAEARLGVAEAARAYAQRRFDAGSAPELEVARADVELGLARDVLVRSGLEVRLASQALRALTGVQPDDREARIATDDTPTPPLEGHFEKLNDLPALQATSAATSAADLRRTAAGRAWWPSLNAYARDRYTNAAGFQPEVLWSVGLALAWRFDFQRPANDALRDAEWTAARARHEAARVAAENLIIEAWHRVEAGRAQVEATRGALDASERAAGDAQKRFDAARATQLDVLIAERERFDARVAQALARTRLAEARATLGVLVGGP